MLKKARLAILLLAGILVYFAGEGAVVAGCPEHCWDEPDGRYCCETWSCRVVCY